MSELKVYTLNEVSEILKVTKRSLYNYIKAGTLRAVKVGKDWRVSEDNLKDFINNGSPVVDANRRPANQKKEGA